MCIFAAKNQLPDMEQTYKLPAVTWLQVTGYMHGWVQWELGSGCRIGEQRVVCVQHLPGARDILRMQTVEDMMEKQPLGIALSATRRNCFDAGLKIDPDVMAREYGVTKEALGLFVPIECPKLCLTKNGVLRPWTLDVTFSKAQARAMQQLLREEFWANVETFDREYARRKNLQKYPAEEMVEAFCETTKTPDLYVSAIRREWQRRSKKAKESTASMS